MAGCRLVVPVHRWFTNDKQNSRPLAASRVRIAGDGGYSRAAVPPRRAPERGERPAPPRIRYNSASARLGSGAFSGRQRAGGSPPHGTSMGLKQVFLEHQETIARAAAHAGRRYGLGRGDVGDSTQDGKLK